MFNGHLDQVDIGELESWTECNPYDGVIGEVMVYNQEQMTSSQVKQSSEGCLLTAKAAWPVRFMQGW